MADYVLIIVALKLEFLGIAVPDRHLHILLLRGGKFPVCQGQLNVIPEIIDRAPSPDTYSLPVSDKEFYFCLDYKILDSLLYAFDNKVSIPEVSQALALSETQVERVFRDFTAKERATWHLREMPPSLPLPT